MEALREKYQIAKIELSFDGNLRDYQKKVEALSAVTACYTDQSRLHVTVEDMAEARRHILAAASAEEWPLTSFSINRASLEDMFMKAVNS
ncbi:DUF4162 domain-containing protein [Lentibacillus sp. CBA3610]|uniref:ATP-binding protein DrrA1-3 family domain-containing protein n=1 Tax=Lentibacillus sp. CBA3610 TaxID=2518176 RepID=UPI00350E4129